MRRFVIQDTDVWPFIAGAASVALTWLLSIAFKTWLGPAGSTMVFLIPVLWSGLNHGRAASVFTAVLSGFACDYFFFNSDYKLGFTTSRDAFILIIFAMVALTTATLTARLRSESAQHRQQRDLARQRSEELAALLALSHAIGSCRTEHELCDAVSRHTGPLLGFAGRVELDDGVQSRGGRAVALSGGDPQRGWLRINGVPDDHPVDPDLLGSLAEMVSLALERMRLRQDMVKARVKAENERFRSMLLSSISHDFRTPLGSISGSVSTLLSEDAQLGEAARRSLLTNIMHANGRLSRFVRNILDYTRVEAEAITPNRDWVELGDIVGAALAATEEVLAGWRVVVDIPLDLPVLRLDFILTEHVFINLFENAAKFATPDNSLTITARREKKHVQVFIANTGSYIPMENGRLIFEQFARGGSETRGVGLGLAICRGFLALQGAAIELVPGSPALGVTFRITVPMEEEMPQAREVADE